MISNRLGLLVCSGQMVEWCVDVWCLEEKRRNLSPFYRHREVGPAFPGEVRIAFLFNICRGVELLVWNNDIAFAEALLRPMRSHM